MITGAAGLLGSAVARAVCQPGRTIILSDLKTDMMSTLAAELEDLGAEAHTFACDVTSEDDMKALASQAASLSRGHISGLFNNAGILGPIGPIENLDIAALDQVLNVNVRGIPLGIKSFAPFLADGSAIVNTSSTSGLRGVWNLGWYVASKHAVLGLTRVAALELAPRGVRVVAACPGGMSGPMIQTIRETADRPTGATSSTTSPPPLGRDSDASEVASMVAFLLSPTASFITGTEIVVDGGRTAGF